MDNSNQAPPAPSSPLVASTPSLTGVPPEMRNQIAQAIMAAEELHVQPIGTYRIPPMTGVTRQIQAEFANFYRTEGARHAETIIIHLPRLEDYDTIIARFPRVVTRPQQTITLRIYPNNNDEENEKKIRELIRLVAGGRFTSTSPDSPLMRSFQIQIRFDALTFNVAAFKRVLLSVEGRENMRSPWLVSPHDVEYRKAVTQLFGNLSAALYLEQERHDRKARIARMDCAEAQAQSAARRKRTQSDNGEGSSNYNKRKRT
ncbi:hypothetical protein LTR09_000093 [Extremus antarcticus]|uniref:Uncharacterized protein n=1 Tax=Extremus antarcticus TaxID=702011 RepID=A0AAJ0LX79_9PEZI|nr:hypothetical protein LTR09_000093 [Extremus antarcticus]